MSHPNDDRPRRLPVVVLVLSAGTFLMGTTEFVIAGLLITAFAAGMIVGAPAMAVATLRLARRSTLVLALVLFAGVPTGWSPAGPLRITRCHTILYTGTPRSR